MLDEFHLALLQPASLRPTAPQQGAYAGEKFRHVEGLEHVIVGTEIDALNGYIARRGAELGVPTPVNSTLHALVRLLEQGVLAA